MSNAQKPNKKLRTKSNRKTGTAGPRAKKNRFKHGIGKNALRSKNSGKKGSR